jgi:type IV pilus assembly protein PilE
MRQEYKGLSGVVVKAGKAVNVAGRCGMRKNGLQEALKSRSGFTLMELMIVGIILAVVAGLAVPGYISAVEKSRKQEAYETLGALRSSEIRYYAGNAKYLGTVNFNELDFNPTKSTGKAYYDYTAAGGAAFTGTATRNGEKFSGLSGCTAGYTITITEAGVITSGC